MGAFAASFDSLCMHGDAWEQTLHIVLRRCKLCGGMCGGNICKSECSFPFCRGVLTFFGVSTWAQGVL